LEEAVELGKKHRIDTIFLAMPRAPREYLEKLADAAGVHFRSVVVIPDLVQLQDRFWVMSCSAAYELPEGSRKVFRQWS
jgi:hypothetical protein